jgi:DNA-binding CsgD family transcriptional regulator
MRYVAGASLTPAETTEVARIARGLCCKDSAAEGRVSPETIRGRRKRIYRKLRAAGRSEVLAGLLAASLRELWGAAILGAESTEQRTHAPAPGGAR